MEQSNRWRNRLYFIAGVTLLITGMLGEFITGLLLPGAIMNLAYQNGLFLSLFILLFAGAMYLIRFSIFGWWRARSDCIIYAIAALLFAAFTAETLLNLQAGKPWGELASTNPVLMILLWAFVFPAINPITTGFLALVLAAITLLNLYKPPCDRVSLSSIPISSDEQKREPWWKVLGQLARFDVWLGSVFLVTLSFLILGGPPLSVPPAFPLHNPFTWLRFSAALISICLLNSFIFIQNQLGDLDTDRAHTEKSKLPLAAGRVSKRVGILLALSMLLVAIILAVLVSLLFFAVLLCIVLLGCLYSGPPLRLKGKPFIDLFMIGLAFGTMAVVAAFVILAAQLELPLLLLIGPGLFYAGTHCVHTASDYAADRQAGLRTTAVILGPRRAIRLGLFLTALGILLLYATVGYYTHLFWWGLLKFKTVILFTFSGLIFFALVGAYRGKTKYSLDSEESSIDWLRRQGRNATYLLFLILLLYCLLYIFLFYPTYVPSSSDFPWQL